MKKRICLSSCLLSLLLITPTAAEVKPGDIITQETISTAEGLLTPSTRWMVERGMRIAQMVVAPVSQLSWNAVSYLSDSERGAGGFGSTGTDGG